MSQNNWYLSSRGPALVETEREGDGFRFPRRCWFRWRAKGSERPYSGAHFPVVVGALVGANLLEAEHARVQNAWKPLMDFVNFDQRHTRIAARSRDLRGIGARW